MNDKNDINQDINDLNKEENSTEYNLTKSKPEKSSSKFDIQK